MDIVDREREIEQLRGLASRPPALVIMRGRRRVGKTYLLRSALTGERVVSLQAEERPRPLQLEAFAREAARLLPGEPPLAFKDWNDGFRFIERQATTGGPVVVVLDEFQYLAASDEGLISTVQRLWDSWEANAVPVMLVLCGSALSFMSGLLAGGSPTYGRSVYRPLLQPFTYRQAAAFAPPSSSPPEVIERFGVLGGTPQYQRWAGPRRLKHVIRSAILPTDAPLYSDPEHLIREAEGIREPGPYFGTLQAIADGHTNTTAIAGRLELKSQLASLILSRLEELQYVSRVEPVSPRGTRQARGFWRIGDPFFRFWFRYVLPSRSRLATGRIDEVASEIEADFSSFMGPVFEDCCREWVARYSDLGEGANRVGPWWSRRSDVEVDVATLSGDEYGVLGSCKWSSRQIGVNVLDDLYEARAAMGPKAARARLVLFGKSGFTDALRARAVSEDIDLVGVADFVS